MWLDRVSVVQEALRDDLGSPGGMVVMEKMVSLGQLVLLDHRWASSVW